ncbi:DUF692 domain-containing protein [Maritimibacter sp. DP1N21-5]|uniref:MNIO family bufferin maturase n=1 Tax=Maritimibacter sp. DP1N21-5 TaxID=2836867 RepID=UPI001C459BF0|nr:DUF692 domain-containing protein [Maritimibacter sp. DP1N21-5]MBV7410286.1 DUF692 domain-containing protein [Maritimibacter sp. DP1N21-5]
MFDMARDARKTGLPARAGVGFKPQHYAEIVSDPGPVGWLEIHAENYMGDGGRPIAQLHALAERFPISVHGVGLSIGGEGLGEDHLARVARLVHWLEPARFSEHLAWSSHGGTYFNDLLPLPYTTQTLARVCDHIDRVQEVLGRRMLLENPSVYVEFAETEMQETDFLREVARRTGCGMLLDVNNVHVSATNRQVDARQYLADFPMHAVGELHLGGHAADEVLGEALLIDSHGCEIADPVWDLFAEVLRRTGPIATLIEWDNDVPSWPVLAAEATRVDSRLAAAARRKSRAKH